MVHGELGNMISKLKNTIILFFLTFSIFILCACDSNNLQNTKLKEVKISNISKEKIEKELTNIENEKKPKKGSKLSELGNIEIKQQISDVKISIPANYVEETSQEELDVMAFEKGYKSATLNPDGSATFVMTKEQHEICMKELATSINRSLNELIGSEEYPNFTKIKANSNFTKFTITTTSQELDINESFSILVFAMYGGMYNVYNGTPIDNVYVEFVNADSGDVIYSINSSDMNK